MKILVPIDFSMYADYALDTAIQVAQKSSAHLYLYHSADIPDEWEDLSAEIKYKDEYNKSKAIWVRNKLDEIKQNVEERGVSCSTYYHGGPFLQNVEEMNEVEDFDLIIMGSHGISGKAEWFLGSNTQKVIRKLRKKVLVVKNKVDIVEFQKAVFVTGLHVSDKLALKEYLDFLSIFDVKEVHILSIDTFKFFAEPTHVMLASLEDFKEITSGLEVDTHFYKDVSIDAGVRHFTKEHDIDIIGISNKVRHPLKRFFSGSNVEMIVNHSDLPVLSIDSES